MSLASDFAHIDKDISYFDIHNSKILQEVYEDMCRKAECVKDAARESGDDWRVVEPLLDSFRVCKRSLARKVKDLKKVELAESISGPVTTAEGKGISEKATQQKSAKEPEKGDHL
ncbi:MAG: hypothetical protein L6R38_006081 [Xanthoria sp. 2 TBL-2021]|nr:MAG: hypothetical protein L6R38_006081 [Xanthoria sp. 2 TBL-2021]